MGAKMDGPKDELLERSFEMEIISNAPNNVELNEPSGNRRE